MPYFCITKWLRDDAQIADKIIPFPSAGQAGKLSSWQAGPVSGDGFAGSFAMLENFRSYQNSIIFYHECEQIKCAKHKEARSISSANLQTL